MVLYKGCKVLTLLNKCGATFLEPSLLFYVISITIVTATISILLAVLSNCFIQIVLTHSLVCLLCISFTCSWIVLGRILLVCCSKCRTSCVACTFSLSCIMTVAATHHFGLQTEQKSDPLVTLELALM